MRYLPLALFALAIAAVAAQSAMTRAAPPEVPYTVQGGGSFYRLDDAVKSLGGGDGTIVIAPGRYADCAVQEGGRVTYRAATPGSAILDGAVCEGKAALVLRGAAATVQGMVFQNMRVPDGNGAGIRLEKGDLSVSDSMFRDSEEGILTADDPAARIAIDHSTFSGLGRCDRGLSCAHSVYTGKYGALSVTSSRFEKGRGGHYLKTWAARVDVTGNSFDDSQGRATNYMIDLSGGATGRIGGNSFVQGRDKENHSAFVTVAPEARANPSAGLAVDGNRAALAPGVTWPTVFLADWSHEPLRLGRNVLGKGISAFETR